MASPPLSVPVANVWFSMAFTVSSIVGTLRLMHVPPPGTGMRVLSWREDYVPGKGCSMNYWGLVAGVLCAIANLLQFQGGRMVGFATADLVQAFPLVSTLWDILLFGEYQQGGGRRQHRRNNNNNNNNIDRCNKDGTYYESSTVVIFYLIGMYVLYLGGIACVIQSSFHPS
ncbi:ureide permease [Nitzschia inconspicua]|uniref:Ureide permease n=1 Tax=Nitzschia inconspicua TaxID=303405 RepID=A0A9K3PJX1_9STRA|nr:ureide permease [Nitzschia inconspicua]